MENISSTVKTEKFRVLKRPLLEHLKKMIRLEKSASRKGGMLEVTLLDGCLQLNAPGMNVKIEAVCSGSARFSIALSYFTEIIKDQPQGTLEFHVTPDCLSIRSSSIPVKTTFFEDDRILRSFQLPANYSKADLAQLIFSGKYTDEEIEFNAQKGEDMEALRLALADFKRVEKILRPYGLKKDFVAQMIRNGLKA